MSGKETRERIEVRAAYPSPSWAAKVDKMSDQQVIAIYFRLRAQGRIK